MGTGFIPDSNIVIYEPLRPQEEHLPSEIRPGYNSATKLEISYIPGHEPYVQIDLDQPGVSGSALLVRDVRLIGNVKTASIWYTATDAVNAQWTEVHDVDMTLPWPAEPIPMGIIKIIPQEATSEGDEYFRFTIEIRACDHIGEEGGNGKGRNCSNRWI